MKPSDHDYATLPQDVKDAVAAEVCTQVTMMAHNVAEIDTIFYYASTGALFKLTRYKAFKGVKVCGPRLTLLFEW
jgi:hypothetical protein